MEETLCSAGPLQEDGPEVTVEVGGTTLPKMTTEEEIQVECSLYPTPLCSQSEYPPLTDATSGSTPFGHDGERHGQGGGTDGQHLANAPCSSVN